MVLLFRFGPVWNEFSCPSQFVLKIETYMRMASIDYNVKSLGINWAETAPKGKLPYIEHDGHTIADSNIILAYLKKVFGDTLDADLSPADRAIAHTSRRMVEEHLWWVMARERWWSPENPYWDTPGLLKEVDQETYEALRDDAQRKNVEHGIGAFTEDELDQRGRDDLESLSILLGDKHHFQGELPTSLDATMYAFLMHIIRAPYQSRLKDAANTFPNLVEYVSRVKSEWFSVDPVSADKELAAH